MKTLANRSLVCVLGITASSLFPGCGPGINLLTCSLDDSFKTVDTFQLVDGSTASPHSMAIDSKGRVFVGGRALNGTNKAVVRFSDDGGDTWTTGPEWANGLASPSVNAIAVDSDDVIYALVSIDASEQVKIASSTDHGQNWTISAGYQYSGGNDTIGQAMVWSDGALYVAASMSDGTHAHWGVLKSTDSGASWEVLDDFGTVTTSAYIPYSIAKRGDRILVVGMVLNVDDFSGWLVRTSANDGSTWTTAQSSNGTASSLATGHAAFIDPFDRLFAGGSVELSSIRKASLRWSDNGSDWTTTNTELFDDSFNQVQTILSDLQGQLLAVGSAVDRTDDDDQYWVRRSTDQGESWESLASFKVVGTAQAGYGGAALAPDGSLYLAGGNNSDTSFHWYVYKLGCK
ncbi:MAG: hypothetical protein IT285_02305 [Bdellovibrionales bacterium]|nr:hypothetical protein [Bdellovibrionales bacterium]